MWIGGGARDDLSDLWVPEYGLRRSGINAILLTNERFYAIHLSPRATTPEYISFNMQNVLLFITSSNCWEKNSAYCWILHTATVDCAERFSQWFMWISFQKDVRPQKHASGVILLSGVLDYHDCLLLWLIFLLKLPVQTSFIVLEVFV